MLSEAVECVKKPRAAWTAHTRRHQLVRLEHGDLLFIAGDGAEWHIVDAMQVDMQVTILSPGSTEAACRIFKPAAGPSLVYVFTHEDEHAARPDLLESQLTEAGMVDWQ